jgi:hypothetical protein
MEINKLRITNGFCGSIGVQYHTPTEDELNEAIEKAAVFNSKTISEIISDIENGVIVKWCKSSNYYYDHSYGTISKKPEQITVEMIKCSCGHTIPATQVMNASMGTSCADCYDRMSY